MSDGVWGSLRSDEEGERRGLRIGEAAFFDRGDSRDSREAVKGHIKDRDGGP